MNSVKFLAIIFFFFILLFMGIFVIFGRKSSSSQYEDAQKIHLNYSDGKKDIDLRKVSRMKLQGLKSFLG